MGGSDLHLKTDAGKVYVRVFGELVPLDDLEWYDGDRYEARLAVFDAACRHADEDIADVLRRLGEGMASAEASHDVT